MALGVARDVLEQDGRGIVGLGVIDHLGDGAHIEVPIGAVDAQQFELILRKFSRSRQPVKAVWYSLLGKHCLHRPRRRRLWHVRPAPTLDRDFPDDSS